MNYERLVSNQDCHWNWNQDAFIDPPSRTSPLILVSTLVDNLISKLADLHRTISSCLIALLLKPKLLGLPWMFQYRKTRLMTPPNSLPITICHRNNPLPNQFHWCHHKRQPLAKAVISLPHFLCQEDPLKYVINATDQDTFVRIILTWFCNTMHWS